MIMGSDNVISYQTGKNKLLSPSNYSKHGCHCLATTKITHQTCTDHAGCLGNDS